MKPAYKQEKPKSHFETLAPPPDGSKSHFETLALTPKSQNETLYKGDLYSSFTETLNVSVREEKKLQPQPPQRSTLNGKGRGIDAVRDKAVEEIVTLTGDEGSRRRFEQLWEIAEGNQALDAWSAALRAVQRRLQATAKQPLDRPGAYFSAICLKELEKREVFVPTNA